MIIITKTMLNAVTGLVTSASFENLVEQKDFQFVITGEAEVWIEGSNDNVTFYLVDLLGSASSQLLCDNTKFKFYHARVVRYTSGTVTVMVAYKAENPNFCAIFDRIAPAANKYMATLFNTSSTNIVMINRILRFNWQVTAVGEGTLDQYITRITARTAGTSVPIRLGDTTDVVPSGVTADTLSTGVTEAHIIRRFAYAQNEIQSAGSVAQIPDWHGYMLAGEPGALLWSRLPDTKGIVLRQNEGVSIRNVTSSTAGSCSYVINFTQVYI